MTESKHGTCVTCGRSTRRKLDPRRPCCRQCEHTAPTAIACPGAFTVGPAGAVARAAEAEVQRQQAEGDAALRARLFAGIYPAGIVYADRSIEEHGDYAKVAFLSYATLELEIHKPRSPLLPRIREDAAKVQARRGEDYQVSQAGQTVRLGYGLK